MTSAHCAYDLGALYMQPRGGGELPVEARELAHGAHGVGHPLLAVPDGGDRAARHPRPLLREVPLHARAQPINLRRGHMCDAPRSYVQCTEI